MAFLPKRQAGLLQAAKQQTGHGMSFVDRTGMTSSHASSPGTCVSRDVCVLWAEWDGQ